MQNPIITVIYSHGRFGSPWYGFKIEPLRLVALKLGMNMISIRYTEDMKVEDMEEKLYHTVKDDVNVPSDLIFLSTSRGAYISTRVAQRIMDFYDTEEIRLDANQSLPKRNVLGQFLIAPAFYIKPDYYPDQNPTPAKNLRSTIVHGFDDKIVSCDNSIKFAKQFKSQLHLMEGGHRLNLQIDRICWLFENFLKDCQTISDKIFAEWLKDNPQQAPPIED